MNLSSTSFELAAEDKATTPRKHKLPDGEMFSIWPHAIIISRLSCLTLSLLVSAVVATTAFGQSAGDVSEQAADRFFQVLLRRPRPGTALDRVYGFHLQRASLDRFLNDLNQDGDDSETGRRQMILGLVQLRRGQTSQAVMAFRRADRLLPDDAMASFFLGKALIEIGETDEAETALLRSSEGNLTRRETPDVFLELARLQLRKGDTVAAVSTMEDLKNRFDGDRSIRERVARALVEEDRKEAAWKEYSALAKQSRNPEEKLRYEIESAELLRELGKTEKATDEFLRLLRRLRPDSWLYRNVRDRLEASILAEESMETLVDFYVAAVKQAPDDLTMRLRLGQIQLLAGKLGESRETVEQVIRQAPNNIDARITLIESLLRDNGVAESVDHFRELVRLDANNPEHPIRWGQALLNDSATERAKRVKAAAKVWGDLAQRNSDDPIIQVRVARLMASIDQVDDAIALYRQAIDLASDSPQYREYLGEFFHDLGRVGEAVEVWKSIAEDERRNRHTLVRLAEVLTTFEYQEQAIDAWRAASTFDLTFDEQMRYGSLLGEAKAYDQAITQIESAGEIAETRDERTRVRRGLLEIYRDSERLAQKILQVGREEPTAENRRFLASMLLENGDFPGASAAIRKSLELSPSDLDSIAIAAQIAERRPDTRRAIELYEKLVELDQRYRTKHLQRLISLHTSLGDIGKSYEIARDLIDAAPANPEGYRVFAAIALGMARDEEGIAALRTAIDYAPRDNSLRLMLAKHLAKTYQTSDAIDLYWDALENEPDIDRCNELITEMAPLYQRRGELDQFFRRLDRTGRDKADPSRNMRLSATFLRSMGDYRRASFILQQLQPQHPNDAELLRELVASLVELSDYTKAVEYQTRLANLTLVPRDVERLTQLQLKLGGAVRKEIFTREIELTYDPFRVAGIIRRAGTQSLEDARDLSGIAIKRDSTLWALICARAQLLLMEPGDDPASAYREAFRIAGKVEALQLGAFASPPSSGKNRVGNTTSKSGSSSSDTYRLSFQTGSKSVAGKARATYTVPRWNFAMYVGRLLGLADAPGVTTQSSRLQASQYLIPEDYHQALWLSRAVRVLARCKLNRLENKPQPLEQVFDDLFSLPPTEETTSKRQVRELISYHHFRNALAGASKPVADTLLWRLAKFDPFENDPRWRSMILARLAGKAPRDHPAPDHPLGEEQLKILADVVAARQKMYSQRGLSAKQLDEELVLLKCLFREYDLAQQPHPSTDIQLSSGSAPNLAQIITDIQVALWQNKAEQADELMTKFTEASRSDERTNLLKAATETKHLTWLFKPSSDDEKEFARRHRENLIDAWFAHCAVRNDMIARTPPRYAGYFGRGEVQIVLPLPWLGPKKHEIKKVETTLSNRWINDYLLRGLAKLALHYPPSDSGAQPTQPQSIPLYPQIVEHLAETPDDATATERRLRGLVHAYSAYWEGRPRECHSRIVELCRQSPSDMELQIEAARMEFDIDETDAGVRRLEGIPTPDTPALIRLNLAKIILFRRIGLRQPAINAAESILALDFDARTRAELKQEFAMAGLPYGSNSVNGRLSRLGFVPNGSRATNAAARAAATRAALRAQIQAQTQAQSRTQNQPQFVLPSPQLPLAGFDEMSQLRNASALLAKGNQMTASEIAYSVLQRYLDNGTAPVAAVRHRSLEILRRAGRLQPLIQTVELKLKSDAGSQVLQDQLTELYVLNEEAGKATALWQRSVEEQNLSPEQVIGEAESLKRKRKHHRAAIYYLFAFEKSPELWKSEWTEFVETAEASKTPSAIYLKLCDVDLGSASIFSLCNVIGLGGGKASIDERRAFFQHLIKTHPKVLEKRSTLLRFIDESERELFPELAQPSL